MSTKSSNPKKEVLLGSALQTLHQESMEWTKSIAFWKDELKFFSDLLDHEQPNASEYGQTLQYLDTIHAALFDYLAADILEHERLLSRQVKGEDGLSDRDYRGKHALLKEQMDLFDNDFKELKKMVFGYARKL